MNGLVRPDRHLGRVLAHLFLTSPLFPGLLAGVMFVGGAHAGGAAPTNDIYAAQVRASTPAYQLFIGLNDDGTVAHSDPAYGPGFGAVGGIYSADFMGDTLYATELDNGNLTDYYLVSIETEGLTRGTATRVSGNAIGAPAVEGLAVIGDAIYVSSLGFSQHRTVLATVDATTGVSTAIGQASRNVMIVALAYDPLTQTLYGAGIPFGSGEGADAVNDNNLYIIDPATGAETLVGDLGTTIQGMTWDDELGLVGAFENLYTIDATTGAATMLGQGDFTDGNPGTFNGIYAIGAKIPDDLEPTCVCGDPVGDGANMANKAALTTAGIITASDALAILKAAVGLLSCELCACDVDDSGMITATDALTVLGVAVGLGNTLDCPLPD